ncbi:MAG: ParB/RepB/Spo0J family partition protein [Candidatus Dormibacteria bacterium]
MSAATKGEAEGLEWVGLQDLTISPMNARAETYSEDETTWTEFKADIKEHGLIEPLVAVKNPEGDGYQVLAGGRRLRALQEIYSNREGKLVAGAPSVPVHVLNVKEAVEQLTISSTENLHRQDMSPSEWAGVIAKLKKMGMNQAQIAKILHKTTAWVSMVKEGKPWVEHKKTSSSQPVPQAREFEDTECPSCGNVLGVSLQDGRIVLEAKGRESVDELERKRAAKKGGRKK